MTLEETIREVSSRGLIVNNLFQYKHSDNSWRWQANITDGVRYWEFGRGDNPAGALRAALFATETTVPEITLDRPIKSTQDYKPTKTPPMGARAHLDTSMLDEI